METETVQTETEEGSGSVPRSFFQSGAIIAIIFMALVFWALLIPPQGFPVGKTVFIPYGATVSDTANILKEQNVISSKLLFRAYMKIFKSDEVVFSGSYLLEKKQPLVEIADLVTVYGSRSAGIKILVTEGSDVLDISKKIKTVFLSFDDQKFIAVAGKEEGYLFPDTYFFFDGTTPENVIAAMKDNFTKKIDPLKEKIVESGHPLSEVIVMASIIEREAVTVKDRRIISGILWKRISIGMPLQVDAAFDYINGKGSSALTASDLKIDSPYNTYVYKGLPPGPIGNPGLDCIVAALEPEKTPYLYYLSDKSGTIHYAKTFEEHVSNKMKYLR